MTQRNPFWYFKTSPEIVRLAVMKYVRLPLSPRNVEDLLHECSRFLVRFASLQNGWGVAVKISGIGILAAF